MQVDAGGRKWTEVDTSGHKWTQVDTRGHKGTQVDTIGDSRGNKKSYVQDNAELQRIFWRNAYK